MVTPLSASPWFTPRPGPVVLCILDGVGIGDGREDDAVAHASTPNLDLLRTGHPCLPLMAHGHAVGMPSEDDLGNSEVGHNAMGAGRVFSQGAMLVNQAIASGAAWETDTWRGLIQGSTLHLLGLFSDGNVHAHVDHLHALIRRAADDGVRRLRVHVLTDGRDVPSQSALTWAGPLEALLDEMKARGLDYQVGSGGGRMKITMDRYQADWGMVEAGWRTHVRGEGRPFPSLTEAITTLYAEGYHEDQWLPAFVITGADGAPTGRIEDGDSVFFFNFRGDRALEISRAFTEERFAAFDRGHVPSVYYAGMLEYDGDLHIPAHYLVPPPAIDRTVGEYLAAAGKRTFAISETQKFGHVTYFFNGNRSGRIDEALEEYVEIAGPTLPLEQRPWMRTDTITDAAVEAILGGGFDHVRLNYPNGDMVGHTGILEATKVGLEAVDLQLARLMRAVDEADGILLVTADHGNADQMYLHNKDGSFALDAEGVPLPATAHTTNPVPFAVFDPRGELTVADLPDAQLAMIGTTILELCGLARPEGYLPGLVRRS
ncbi:MAG: 2,3-bisphosphoglycerate-independent phosphoglycerate mutase [Deltaproteobacteria bacterium]|nr:2,3-bisphosphoglycerate-independent phosphoglycerate mutase [Deltaproteobacteria bacterium]